MKGSSRLVIWIILVSMVFGSLGEIAQAQEQKQEEKVSQENSSDPIITLPEVVVEGLTGNSGCGKSGDYRCGSIGRPPASS